MWRVRVVTELQQHALVGARWSPVHGVATTTWNSRVIST
jgi:hypothetical protein